MKLNLIILCALSCAQAYAAPKPEAEGIYVADSTISHAPPRTTFALIEPNGEVWSAVDWTNRTAAAIYGDINPKTGNGYGSDFIPNLIDMSQPRPDRQALRITTKITDTTIHFTFYDDKPGGGVSSAHHQLQPQGKRAAYDVDLSKQLPEPISLPNTVLTSNGFTISIAEANGTGSLNNCLFNASIKDAKTFKRLVLTLKNDCFDGPNGITPLTKGTKFEGVLFPSTLIGFEQRPVFVLVAKTKTGKEYIGFSRTFTR